jgi:ubiquinone/menaquinone biosynthesis C-methylase UbiE
VETLAASDVQALFNRKAGSWRRKYALNGKLHARVERFAGRLCALCPPPARVLDLGCGTGEIAAAIDRMGYQVTACDFAEGMIEIARSSHTRTGVTWICLKPDWEVLPFRDNSFDGIVASSVFEYLFDVQGVAAELARVLRPEGVMLLTVPNPRNVVRKIEAWARPMLLNPHLSRWVYRVRQIDSYATYLRLSRNRFEGHGWQSVLETAHFVPMNERDFSEEAWRNQAKAPLVLLAMKRVEMGQPATDDDKLSNRRISSYKLI